MPDVFNKKKQPARHYSRLVPEPLSQSGFTLLEFLVVLMILGVLTHFSIGAFSGSSEKQQIHIETKKLARLISLAASHASLNSQYIGLKVNRHSYYFVVRADDSWKPLRDKLLRRVTLPQPLHLEFSHTQETEQNATANDDVQKNSNIPNILIATSGEMSPFGIRIIGEENIAYFELLGKFSGHLTIKKTDLTSELQ